MLKFLLCGATFEVWSEWAVRRASRVVNDSSNYQCRFSCRASPHSPSWLRKCKCSGGIVKLPNSLTSSMHISQRSPSSLGHFSPAPQLPFQGLAILLVWWWQEAYSKENLRVVSSCPLGSKGCLACPHAICWPTPVHLNLLLWHHCCHSRSSQWGLLCCCFEPSPFVAERRQQQCASNSRRVLQEVLPTSASLWLLQLLCLALNHQHARSCLPSLKKKRHPKPCQRWRKSVVVSHSGHAGRACSTSLVACLF